MPPPRLVPADIDDVRLEDTDGGPSPKQEGSHKRRRAPCAAPRALPIQTQRSLVRQHWGMGQVGTPSPPPSPSPPPPLSPCRPTRGALIGRALACCRASCPLTGPRPGAVQGGGAAIVSPISPDGADRTSFHPHCPAEQEQPCLSCGGSVCNAMLSCALVLAGAC
jgi:hypothetical protein